MYIDIYDVLNKYRYCGKIAILSLEILIAFANDNFFYKVCVLVVVIYDNT